MTHAHSDSMVQACLFLLLAVAVADDATCAASSQGCPSKMQADANTLLQTGVRIGDELAPGRTDEEDSEIGEQETAKDMNLWMDHVSSSLLSFEAIRSDPAALCDWSKGEPTFAPWPTSEPEVQIINSAVQELFEAKTGVLLKGGNLLGAYRHHGSIPFDLDVDLIFQICDPEMPDTPGAVSLAHMSCNQIAQERASMKDKTAFNRKVYEDMFAPKLVDTNIKLVMVTGYGLRLTNGARQWDGGLSSQQGIGIDVEFHTGDETRLAVCTCSYGPSSSLCPLDAQNMLTTMYGKDFMIPKSQCQHYADLGHPDWNQRSKEDCLWAENIKPR